MLTYDMSPKGHQPLYEYLYNCIRKDIMSGKINPGDKLPSKRELASYLGISIITVQNAYEQLIVEGYLYAEEKRGYFVNNIEFGNQVAYDNTSVGRTTHNQVSERTLNDVINRSDNHPSTEAKQKPSFIDFTSSHVLYDKFPYATWAKLMRRTLLDNEKSFIKSLTNTGVYELRLAIAEYLSSYRGFTANPDNIIIGAGTEYLYSLVVRLLGHSKMIAVEDPGYGKITKVYESDGLKVLHIPLDDKGLIVDKLPEGNVSAVHISPSHQFPTGSVMPVARRQQLLSWANEYGSYIIEDDYDSEFRFTGKLIPAMASMDSDKVIYMNTFSKTLAPSIRIAYMILPDALMNKFREKLGFYSGTVSGFDQYTLAAFIKEGYYGRHISRMRNYYRDYRNRIISAIRNSEISKYTTIEEDNSGLHFILSFDNVVSDDNDFVNELKSNGVKILPLSAYCHNVRKQFNHKFIVSYSDITVEDLNKALDIMNEVIKNIQI